MNLIKRIRYGMIENWSIGIYYGSTPFKTYCYADNPVISAKEVTDIIAKYVADPFIIEYNNLYYLFFEAFNVKSSKGEIGLACSRDCLIWEYQKIVLTEDFHLSYPLVFQHENSYYMIPETYQANAIRLYQAREFPYRWEFITNLIEGHPFIDSTLFYHDRYWWLFTTHDSKNLNIFYSNNLYNKWLEHPKNPIYTGELARLGGRVLLYDDKILRFSQNPNPIYGSSLTSYEITKLNPNEYDEKKHLEVFMGPSGKGWNEKRMHHVDFINNMNNWIVVTDGYSEALSLRPNYIFFSLKDMIKRLLY